MCGEGLLLLQLLSVLHDEACFTTTVASTSGGVWLNDSPGQTLFGEGQVCFKKSRVWSFMSDLTIGDSARPAKKVLYLRMIGVRVYLTALLSLGER